ncbi:7TM diverse intracellular signaling domain-containing protein [Bernardetia sp. ABR2-2B]|uniref:7TM diverse intracellular signaling domain-containing protein n=1 Tax=Bernardetia sp. ABR2-2B TaxID=3127472 RepID=UPI0030D4198E
MNYLSISTLLSQKRFLFVLLFALLSTTILAKESVVIDSTENNFHITPFLNYYTVENDNLSIEDITNKDFSDSLYLTKNTKYIWTYADIKIEDSEKWLITIEPRKNGVLYLKDTNNTWSKYTSSDYIYSKYKISFPPISKALTHRIYIKIPAQFYFQSSKELRISVISKKVFEEDFLTNTIVSMLVLGAVFALFFYNLFLAISTKSWSYLFYSLFLCFLGVRFLTASSVFKELYLTIEQIVLFSNISMCLTIVSYILFCLAYFRMSYKNTWSKILLLNLMVVVTFLLSSSISRFYNSSIIPLGVADIFTGILFICIFIFSVQKVRQKALGAREFLATNIILILVSFVFIVFNIYLDNKTSTIQIYFLNGAIVIQMLLFSFTLAARFNLIKKQIAEKELEKEQLEKNQILEVQKLIEQKNTELEQKVTHRTQELSEKNEEMGQLIEKLDTTNESLKTVFSDLQIQHNKVTDSIRYANNIQEAILPNIDKIQSTFSDFFVFFRPRDVVSGDFYWYLPLENDRHLIGAFDCTGHGVPGAFMSLISYQILNETVLVKNKTMPNEILDELRKEIYFSLKQNETKNKDGLDACLILIDKPNEMLYFSGAKNPLYYVKDNSFETIKGDNIYIGGSYGENKFTLHQVPFREKDTLFYLSSDGIQDQFGGENNMKVMRKTFKKLLLQNENLANKEQPLFWDNFITNWKGNNQQTDDILLIGIRP